jgi:tRNA pseudouridine38-40 synthase
VHSPEGTRYRATVHYDGSAFAGWQVQPDVRTVQGDIEAALQRLEISGRVHGAGRTDAGVHAAGQEISFDAPPSWNASELARALASLLPGDIWIEALQETRPDFHPRFQATGRRYEYYLAAGEFGRAPSRRRNTSWIDRAPEVAELRSATRPILGRHCFGAFARSGQPDLGTLCTVEKAEWLRTPLGDLRFTIVADRFLHRMVRYLVATIVEEAGGSRPPGDVARLLADSGDVRPPGPAEACGLYLTGVRYRMGWNRSPGVPGLWPVVVWPRTEGSSPADAGSTGGEEAP